MTAIAFKDGFVAADTLAVSASHHRAGSLPKIRRAPTGEVLATVGYAPTSFDILNWWLKGREGDQPDHDTAGSLIVFGREGATVFCGGGSQPEAAADFQAYGSGQQFALGAMAMGATARQAVEIAARYDIYTGGEITVMEL